MLEARRDPAGEFHQPAIRLLHGLADFHMA